MKKTVGAYEAKTHFSRLLDEAARGTTIVITRNGDPAAELRPLGTRSERMRGLMGEIARLRKGARLTGISARELIEEGRT